MPNNATEKEFMSQEIAELESEKRNLESKLKRLKRELSNQKFREIREVLQDRGFLLEDLITGKAELNSLADAIWYNDGLVELLPSEISRLVHQLKTIRGIKR